MARKRGIRHEDDHQPMGAGGLRPGELGDAAEAENRPVYTIAIAAQLLGLAPRTIRAYEEAGLLAPARGGRNRQRLYSPQDLRWLRCIHEMVHDEGYTLRSIRRLLDFAPCWEIRRCRPEVSERCAGNLRIPPPAVGDKPRPEEPSAKPAGLGASTTAAGESSAPPEPRAAEDEAAPDRPLVHIRIIYGLQEFGTVMHCSRCIHAERLVRRVAAEFGPQVMVSKHGILSTEARQFGVLMTPSIVINDEVVSLGRAPSEQHLRQLIERHLAARLG